MLITSSVEQESYLTLSYSDGSDLSEWIKTSQLDIHLDASTSGYDYVFHLACVMRIDGKFQTSYVSATNKTVKCKNAEIHSALT